MQLVEEAEACLPAPAWDRHTGPGGVSAAPGQPDPTTSWEADRYLARQASGTSWQDSRSDPD